MTRTRRPAVRSRASARSPGPLVGGLGGSLGTRFLCLDLPHGQMSMVKLASAACRATLPAAACLAMSIARATSYRLRVSAPGRLRCSRAGVISRVTVTDVTFRDYGLHPPARQTSRGMFTRSARCNVRAGETLDLIAE
jgi:hypothetical protein